MKGRIVLCDDLDEVKLAYRNSAEGILYKNKDFTPYATRNGKLPSIWFTHTEAQKIRDHLRYAKLILYQ